MNEIKRNYIKKAINVGKIDDSEIYEFLQLLSTRKQTELYLGHFIKTVAIYLNASKKKDELQIRINYGNN